jgi:hypothetical protein
MKKILLILSLALALASQYVVAKNAPTTLNYIYTAND